MSNPATKFITAVRGKLAEAKVSWDVEPDLNWHTTIPSLTAVSTKDPSKTFTMTFPKGLSAEPFDDVVDEFAKRFMEAMNE